MAASSDLEGKAKDAVVDDQFELASEFYTRAIEAGPPTADLFADSAQAHIKLAHYIEAVADANKAIELDSSMHKAYLQKGAVCIKLEEYQTAKAALELGSSLAPEEASQEPVKRADAASSAVLPSVVAGAEDKESPHMDNLQQILEMPSKLKYRHDFYNNATEVALTIFAKRILAEHVNIDFGEQILSVAIEVPGEETYLFQPRLFDKIITEKCKYHVLSTKIEVHLAKAEPVAWALLECSGKTKALALKINSPAMQIQRPLYPSSKFRRDWDKLEAEVKKEEKEEKLDDDDDDDAVLNKFFRHL